MCKGQGWAVCQLAPPHEVGRLHSKSDGRCPTITSATFWRAEKAGEKVAGKVLHQMSIDNWNWLCFACRLKPIVFNQIFFSSKVMEQLHLAPSMYLATAVEVVRRKAFSRNFLQVSELHNHNILYVHCDSSKIFFVAKLYKWSLNIGPIMWDGLRYKVENS